jgi:imidazolonepropionase
MESLRDLVLSRTRIMARYGTTTAEAKSGYGLTLEDEVKQLRAIRAASAESAVRLVPTCLAAHEFPPECSKDDAGREEYVDRVIGEILPAAGRESLARFCDVFVEHDVFTREQGRRILEAGRALGMMPRIHADELSDTDGAALAAELACASADHLMFISSRGVKALAASDTVANLLPGTSFFLMSDRYAPARDLIDEGAVVSLSTDCNPGSSMTESMQIVIQIAVLRMKMTVEEALTAATLNGAYSLRMSGEIGSIEPGKCADFVILDAPSYFHLVYHYGVNLVAETYRDGVRR